MFLLFLLFRVVLSPHSQWPRPRHDANVQIQIAIVNSSTQSLHVVWISFAFERIKTKEKMTFERRRVRQTDRGNNFIYFTPMAWHQRWQRRRWYTRCCHQIHFIKMRWSFFCVCLVCGGCTRNGKSVNATECQKWRCEQIAENPLLFNDEMSESCCCTHK